MDPFQNKLRNKTKEKWANPSSAGNKKA